MNIKRNETIRDFIDLDQTFRNVNGEQEEDFNDIENDSYIKSLIKSQNKNRIQKKKMMIKKTKMIIQIITTIQATYQY